MRNAWWPEGRSDVWCGGCGVPGRAQDSYEGEGAAEQAVHLSMDWCRQVAKIPKRNKKEKPVSRRKTEKRPLQESAKCFRRKTGFSFLLFKKQEGKSTKQKRRENVCNAGEQ
jgi:hypothetical protein